MPRSSRILPRILTALFCGFTPLAAQAAEDVSFYHENVMGTSLELHVLADSADAARGAESRVLREIERLAAIFSSYDRESEFSRWQGSFDTPTKVSPELFEVLQASDDWRLKSGGAFDPRVEALTRLWSSCARQDRTPTPEELAQARGLMSRDAWRLDPAARTAEHLSNCPLTLNAIAKGFIVERACQAALDPDRGVRGLLLNIGGDLHVGGETVRTIGIANPRADSESSAPLTFIDVRDRSVGTSGNAQRGWRIQGRWYSHILDPRTGWPAERTISATVITGRSADADALDTIFNVLSVDESLRLARSLPDVECLIVASDGRLAPSDGWNRYEKAQPPLLALADDKKTSSPETKTEAPEASPWNEFELFVPFEINEPEGNTRRDYRRPYVAVWVENKEGFPVRNLLLWVSHGGSGPYQWLPDLKRWYRSDEARRMVDRTDMVQTISRPTRPPGKYSVIWDGKDGHGKLLPAGEYTLFIDAAREHGTYQSISKQITIGNQPFVEDLKGNVEIKSASIEYRRKGQGK
jgi:thiamine biosynthesis lipoprotein ApbE